MGIVERHPGARVDVHAEGCCRLLAPDRKHEIRDPPVFFPGNAGIAIGPVAGSERRVDNLIFRRPVVHHVPVGVVGADDIGLDAAVVKKAGVAGIDIAFDRLQPVAVALDHDDVDFILETAARYLSRDPTRADVTSVWAGLRPLVKATGESSTASLSREHTIVVSKAGLITVTGGKWTTYRKMAEDVVDTAIRRQMLRAAPCVTADLPLHGAGAWAGQQANLNAPDRYYGGDLGLLRSLPGADNVIAPESGLTEAHVRFAARYELARKVEDVVARRNRLLFLDARAAEAAAPRVAAILAEELGHDAAWQQAEIDSLRSLAASYRLDGGAGR